MRGDILSVRERDYVLAARVIGVKDSRILLKHILPNAIFPTLVLASLDVGGYVLSFAALSFLGIGTEIGYADWGQLLSFARTWITNLADYWYIVVWPGHGAGAVRAGLEPGGRCAAGRARPEDAGHAEMKSGRGSKSGRQNLVFWIPKRARNARFCLKIIVVLSAAKNT